MPRGSTPLPGMSGRLAAFTRPNRPVLRTLRTGGMMGGALPLHGSGTLAAAARPFSGGNFARVLLRLSLCRLIIPHIGNDDKD
jgi:hypothetical protein